LSLFNLLKITIDCTMCTCTRFPYLIFYISVRKTWLFIIWYEFQLNEIILKIHKQTFNKRTKTRYSYCNPVYIRKSLRQTNLSSGTDRCEAHMIEQSVHNEFMYAINDIRIVAIYIRDVQRGLGYNYFWPDVYTVGIDIHYIIGTINILSDCPVLDEMGISLC